MKIETKFEIGENVVLINYDKIITLPVKGIEYSNKTIQYYFSSNKAATTMDKDIIIYRDEDECFKSVKELSEYYESKQVNKWIMSNDEDYYNKDKTYEYKICFWSIMGVIAIVSIELLKNLIN